MKITPNEVLSVIRDALRQDDGQRSAVEWENGKMVVRASACGGCLRSLWYCATKTVPLPHSLESLYEFELGHHLHEAIRKALSNKFDLSPEEEVIYENFALKIVGHIDGDFAGEDGAILEIKSTKPYGLKMYKKTPEFDRGYKAQAHVYMKGKNRKRVIVLILSKLERTAPSVVIHAGLASDEGEQAMFSFEEHWDQRFWDLLLLELEMLAISVMQKGSPPDRLPLEVDLPEVKLCSWACSYCPYVHKCRLEEQNMEVLARKRKTKSSKMEVKPGYYQGWSVLVGNYNVKDKSFIYDEKEVVNAES